MKKTILTLILTFLVPFLAYADFQFQGTLATPFETIDSDTLINDIGTTIYQEIVNPMERLLQEYRQGAKLTYSSGATLQVTTGQIATQNGAGTRTLFSESTTNINATFSSNLDTGSESNSTTYYVYGIGSLTSGTFTIKFSASATTPSGSDYYFKLGSFYNNSSGNIEQISNDNSYLLIETGTVAHGGTVSLPSGYSANVGVISGLMKEGDLIVMDILSHASLIDGARLSGADLKLFRHNNPNSLDRVLSKNKNKRKLVCFEGFHRMLHK